MTGPLKIKKGAKTGDKIKGLEDQVEISQSRTKRQRDGTREEKVRE